MSDIDDLVQLLYEDLIWRLYDAFNRRDIDACVALMTEGVDWPKASEGGRVVGKDEIRAYWTRQWAEFDPRVDPLSIENVGDGMCVVQVHQLVEDRHGSVLSDQAVTHTFTITDGLVASMSVSDAEPAFGK